MKTLEELDVFTLIGMENLPEEIKFQRLNKMQEIILTDFLRNDMYKYLSKDELYLLDKEVQKGLKPEDLLNRIRELIPNYEEVLYKKAQEFKKTLAKNQLQLKLDIINKRKELLDTNLYPRKNPSPEEKVSALQELEDEKTVLTQVLSFYEKDLWEDGVKILRRLRTKEH